MLADMKAGKLRKRAAACAVPESELEAADDADNPKAAYMELVVRYERADRTATAASPHASAQAVPSLPSQPTAAHVKSVPVATAAQPLPSSSADSLRVPAVRGIPDVADDSRGRCGSQDAAIVPERKLTESASGAEHRVDQRPVDLITDAGALDLADAKSWLDRRRERATLSDAQDASALPSSDALQPLPYLGRSAAPADPDAALRLAEASTAEHCDPNNHVPDVLNPARTDEMASTISLPSIGSHQKAHTPNAVSTQPFYKSMPSIVDQRPVSKTESNSDYSQEWFPIGALVLESSGIKLTPENCYAGLKVRVVDPHALKAAILNHTIDGTQAFMWKPEDRRWAGEVGTVAEVEDGGIACVLMPKDDLHSTAGSSKFSRHSRGSSGSFGDARTDALLPLSSGSSTSGWSSPLRWSEPSAVSNNWRKGVAPSPEWGTVRSSPYGSPTPKGGSRGDPGLSDKHRSPNRSRRPSPGQTARGRPSKISGAGHTRAAVMERTPVVTPEADSMDRGKWQAPAPNRRVEFPPASPQRKMYQTMPSLLAVMESETETAAAVEFEQDPMN
eukprot:SAG31_NODE_6677_length_1928_cov_4.077948_1_plen_561_part_10